MNHGTTLSELVPLVYHKVVCEGEIVDLKFTCRFPLSQYGAVINYMAISVVDDSILEKVLNIPSIFSAVKCVEVYIEKVHHVVPGPQSIPSGPYTRLLTLGSESVDDESPFFIPEEFK